MKTALTLCFLFLSACSMYKSNGRKQLEADAASGGLQTQSFALESCQHLSSMQAWFQSEFPTRKYEIVTSQSDLEILKSTATDGTVQINAIQINNNQKISCLYRFANERTWNKHQTRFIEELENNLMTTE